MKKTYAIVALVSLIVGMVLGYVLIKPISVFLLPSDVLLISLSVEEPFRLFVSFVSATALMVCLLSVGSILFRKRPVFIVFLFASSVLASVVVTFAIRRTLYTWERMRSASEAISVTYAQLNLENIPIAGSVVALVMIVVFAFVSRQKDMKAQ